MSNLTYISHPRKAPPVPPTCNSFWTNFEVVPCWPSFTVDSFQFPVARRPHNYMFWKATTVKRDSLSSLQGHYRSKCLLQLEKMHQTRKTTKITYLQKGKVSFMGSNCLFLTEKQKHCRVRRQWARSRESWQFLSKSGKASGRSGTKTASHNSKPLVRSFMSS